MTTDIVIIDDQDGDPVTGNKIVYSPADAWALGAIGGCPKCAVPSSGIAYRGSFHGSLFDLTNLTGSLSLSPPTATVSFFGTAVNVSIIISEALTTPAGQTNMTFTIDGKSVAAFGYAQAATSEFQPNVTVFNSIIPLPLANHTLTITNGHSGGLPSIVILDSISYRQ
ncbi:hypothetical protein B0H13DRAFT_2649494, partial [Mycena leptocephala]